MSADRPPTPDRVFPIPLSSGEVTFLNDNAPFFGLINPGQLTDEQITVLRKVRRDAGLAVNKQDQSPEALAVSNGHAAMVYSFVSLLAI